MASIPLQTTVAFSVAPSMPNVPLTTCPSAPAHRALLQKQPGERQRLKCNRNQSHRHQHNSTRNMHLQVNLEARLQAASTTCMDCPREVQPRTRRGAPPQITNGTAHSLRRTLRLEVGAAHRHGPLLGAVAPTLTPISTPRCLP